MDFSQLRNVSYQCLLDLTTDEGINASSLTEAYGCIFGRDSALTILKLLNVYRRTKDRRLIDICRKTLLTLMDLQGTSVNVESGEEPGKIIHEFRKEKYDRLTKRARPWYVYADMTIKNYDSIDATPLTLIAFYRFWQVTRDEEFLLRVLPHIEAGLKWLVMYTDKDGDRLVEYELLEFREHGGLPVQSWTDSFESLVDMEGKFPVYPIAAVEVQGYAWLAFKLWSAFYRSHSPRLSLSLKLHAKKLKKQFNLPSLNPLGVSPGMEQIPESSW